MNARATIFAAVLSGFALVSRGELSDEVKKQALDRIMEWERAALNRELAATTQQLQAEEMLKEATALRFKEFLTLDERRANMKKAGDKEKSAGDRAGAACGNFDRAAANWNTVAREYEKLEDKKNRTDALVMSRLARERAFSCGEIAASAYELAAEAYMENNANRPANAAAASERAASWREKLAGRR